MGSALIVRYPAQKYQCFANKKCKNIDFAASGRRTLTNSAFDGIISWYQNEGVAGTRLRAASQHTDLAVWLALNCETHV
jgi:hypothetical protein